MDLGVAPRHSHRLAGLPPSTSPPPLGKRSRRSRWTHTHIDSHTMGDHEDGIPELSSPLHVDDEKFNPSFDPSPDAVVHSEFDPSHERHTHSSYDTSFIGHRYGMSGDETHHEPTSTSYVSYGMFGNPIHDMTFFAKMELDPNTMPGGIPISFHAERFGSMIHITPSIPKMEATSHVRPRPGVSNPIRIPEPT